MKDFLNVENIKSFLAILTAIVAAISAGLAIQWKYFKQKSEVLESLHKTEIAKLELKQQELDKLKADAQSKTEPLVQEMKMVYVKYLHIRKESEAPVYQKFIERLDETIDVHSEYHYYRFNKFNKDNNSITLTDKSSGVVDLKILYPWKDIVFTDIPSQKHKGSITQDVSNSDTYFCATTYYNGFKEKNEDIGMKMEMDTLCAKIIADFSSIVGLKKLFIKEPDAYKMELNKAKIKLVGLEKISDGVYHIEVHNLKKGEALLLDFHVNWDYLND